MAFCSSCGASLVGAYCRRCGSPASQRPSAPTYSPSSQSKADIPQNVAAALCYLMLLVSGVVFLVLEPYSKDKAIRFHAFQSILFHLAAVAIYLLESIVFSTLRALLPYGMWFLFSFISVLIFLALLGTWGLLMYKAYNRERFKIPILGDFAEKQA